MSNNINDFIAGKVRKWLEKKNPELSGAYSEWPDLTPWRSVYSNGIFEGKDNSFWMFFRAPENVRIEWNFDEEQSMENQMFLNQVIGRLAESLDTGSSTKTRDMRRGFVISKLRSRDHGVYYNPQTDSPVTIDFRKRMSESIERPQWHGYMGIELKSKGYADTAISMKDFADQFVQGTEDPLTRFLPDLKEIVEIMEEHGFHQLSDFDVDSPDYQNLTAWHGVENSKYGMPRHLATTEFDETTEGFSVITPAWDEIEFSVAVPKENLGLLAIKDPRSESSQWARPLFVTSNNTVGIWVNGQIRGKKALDSILRSKRLSRRRALWNTSDDDDIEQEKAAEELSLVGEALTSATMENVDLLDNVEILVATQCVEGEINRLRNHMNQFDMEIRIPIHRQAKALMRTLPTYNKPLSKLRRSNLVRGEFSAQMLTGALSMSGLLKQTKPAANNGILLGFTYGDNEFKDIFTEIDGAYKTSSTPIMLVTGRSGSGKTTQILMMIAQAVYDGKPTVFLNPKMDSTQAHYFEMLDGTTISMSEAYLRDNPGMLDPFQFFRTRQNISSILSDAILTAMKIYQDTGSENTVRESILTNEINYNAIDTRNRCAYDVFFGNKEGRKHYNEELQKWNNKLKGIKESREEEFIPEVDGAISDEGRRYISRGLSLYGGTIPISDLNARKFLENKIASSTFWAAFISKDPDHGSELRDAIESGAPVNIEWDGKLRLPDVDTKEADYKQEHIESILSVNLAFIYAEELITREKKGGMLVIDEAWVLKKSKEARNILNRSGREWRSRNIMAVLATQMIRDFADTDEDSLLSSVDRFLFLATPDIPEEREAFFRITGLMNTDKYWDYMVKAGIRDADNNLATPVAKGYYIDRIYKFSGGLMLGPWPQRELTMGRTDSEAESLRKSMFENEDINALQDVYTSGGSMSTDDFQKFISGSDSFQFGEE